MLREHEGSLRNIYNGFADAGEEHGALTSKTLMSFNEWMSLCECLQLIDVVFSRRSAVLCFVWSRMRVVDEARGASRLKMIHLSFEDFLEAIVRMSTMKALPDDEEMASAGSTDAGRHLLELRHTSPQMYEDFLKDHAQSWFDEPLQPIHRRAAHHAARPCVPAYCAPAYTTYPPARLRQDASTTWSIFSSAPSSPSRRAATATAR